MLIEDKEPNQWRNQIVSYIEGDIDSTFFNATFLNENELSWRIADNAIKLAMAVISAPKEKLPEDQIPEDMKGTHHGLAFSDPFFAGMIVGMGEMFACYNIQGVFALDFLSPGLTHHSATDRVAALESMMVGYAGGGIDLDMSRCIGLGGVTSAMTLMKMLRMPIPKNLLFESDEEKNAWTEQLFPWYENYQMTRQLALNYDVHLVDHLNALEEAEVSDIIGEDFEAQLKKLLGEAS
jgi:hypothetical protein